MGTGTLGAAVYELVFDTRQVAKMTTAEGKVVAATDGMEAATLKADESVMKLASDTGLAAGRISASYKEAAAGAAQGADEISAAAAKGAAATSAGAAKSESALMRFGKIGGGMGQMLGLGAAYFAIKGGFEWMKSAQSGMLAVNQTLKATGNVAGVTRKDVSSLSDTFTKWTGDSRGTNLQLLQLLLTFKNLRNVGAGNLAIFDRSAKLVEDIAVGTHRSTRMIALAMGKVMNDPANNLQSLGRAGIRFNKVQQQMVKDIQAGNEAFQGQKGLVGAQLYVFSQLSAWTGKAAAQTNSLSTRLHVAKDAIDAASAKIIQALLPAFVSLTHIIGTVAEFLARHTTALKRLVVAFILAKTAAFAFNRVMTLMKLGSWAAGMMGLTTATEAEAGAASAAATSTGAFSAAALAGLAPIAAIALAVGGLILEWQSLTKAQNEAVAAWNKVGTPQRNANAFYAQRVAVYEKQGMSPADAKKKAAAETLKVTGLPGGKAGIAAAQAETQKYGKPGTVPEGAAKFGKGGGILPLAMQIQLAISQRMGAKVQIAQLKKEQTYLYDLLKKTKDPNKVLAIQQELTSIWSNMTGLQTSLTNKANKNKYSGVVPIAMALAYQKALRTKGLADDIKVLKEEEGYFAALVKQHKGSAAKQLAYSTELTRVQTKLQADLKKQAAARAAAKHNFDIQMQAFVDTRGSFFSQFASSIFQAGPGGLTMGATPGGGDKTVNQHNTFNEIPKDRYKLSRNMQAQMAHSM